MINDSLSCILCRLLSFDHFEGTPERHLAIECWKRKNANKFFGVPLLPGNVERYTRECVQSPLVEEERGENE